MTYAFPHNTVVVDKEGGVIEHYRGMEIRDYFAAKAMQALIDNDGLFSMIPIQAYAIADEMMKAREA